VGGVSIGKSEGKLMKRSLLLSLLFIVVVISIFLAKGLTTNRSAKIQAELTVLYSGEDIGYLETCGCAPGQLGGIAKRDTVIKSLRDKAQNKVLLLHNGDIINEPGLQQELKYQTAIAAMGEMGYDILNVGDGDFWLGIEQLRTMMESCSFPFVSANVLIHNGKYFQPYILKEMDLGGIVVKVGVIGCLSTAFEPVIKQIGLDLTISPPSTILSSQLHQLNQKADLIIMLAHCDIAEAKDLAKEFPEINVIVSGHQSDEGLDEPITFGKTLIVNPGIKGRKLGELKLILDKNRKVIDYEHRLISLPEEIPDSPTISVLMSLYYKMLEDFDLLSKTEKVELPVSDGAYVGSKSCKACHEKAYATWQASKHAHAYDTLVRVKRNFNPECIGCHTIGYRYSTGFVSVHETPELKHVGCESCHGAGDTHSKNPQKGYGKVATSDCLGCHTKETSPKFEFEKYRAKIMH